ncbi:MAG: aspartyl protease family protein [Burkholderiaceae bacterium]
MSNHRAQPCARMSATRGLRPSFRHLLGVIALIASGLVPATLAHAACQVRTLELPVKMIGSRAVATVGINGTPVTLTVDSGAFYSILTDAAAEQLKLTTRRNDGPRVQGITGLVETRKTKVEKLQLLGGDIPNVEFIVGGNEPGAGTMGLMGRNLLSFTDTEYDLAHGVIRFHFPDKGCANSNMAYWAGSSPVTEIELDTPYRARTPAVRANVKLDGRELMALFDTGATTMVSTRAAEHVGVAERDMTPAGSIYGAGRGTAKAWTAHFSKFELGGEAISNNTLSVSDFDLGDVDMLLGIDFFLAHRIYISNAQSKMYLTYSGGKVFALNKSERPGVAAFEGDQPAAGAQGANADQLARRGAASAARNDYESALADLNQACELEPTTAAFLAQRGVIQEALKRPAKALEDYDKALELEPTQADARARRAGARLAAKDRDGAKADLDALDRTLAPQAQMRLGMSRLYVELDQPALALAQLDQWLSAHPNEILRGSALHSRCLIRLRLGIDLDKALDDCDDAVSSNSRNASFLDTRGWIRLRLGKYRNALADFDRSIEYRPKNAWALYGRGLTKIRQGDAAQADADLADARKLQPDIDLRVTKAGLTTEAAPQH